MPKNLQLDVFSILSGPIIQRVSIRNIQNAAGSEKHIVRFVYI